MKFKTISVLIPTRGRVSKLRRALDSLRDNADDPSIIELVLRVDFDDKLTQTFLRQRQEMFIVGPREKGYASLPKFMNQCASISTGDVIMMFNDDAIVETSGWDTKLLSCANDYPDGVFNIGVDTGLNANLFPFSIVSRRIFKKLGFINDERLMFSDIFLLDVFETFNRAIRLRGVKMTHDWAGFDATDETRKSAHVLENEIVFNGQPGDASEPKRNWREAYRRLHEVAVREAVQKILDGRAGNGLSGLYGDDAGTEGVENSSEGGNLGVGSKRVQGAPTGENFLDIVARLRTKGHLSKEFLISPLWDAESVRVWREVFAGGIGLNSEPEVAGPFPYDSYGDVMVYKVDMDSTSALFRFRDFCFERKSEICGRLKTLIIEDVQYPKSIAVYHMFKKILLPGSAVVFVHRRRAGSALANEHFVARLESGAIDGRRHQIERFTDRATDVGYSLEFELP
ncbi:MAG: glycosyltransferase family A protein [Gammaproteobacteria bacterium]|jgi:hypothetical protein|nr:glycosyltransferase family A protein [Gammaproteobacteria bacterium]